MGAFDLRGAAIVFKPSCVRKRVLPSCCCFSLIHHACLAPAIPSDKFQDMYLTGHRPSTTLARPPSLHRHLACWLVVQLRRELQGGIAHADEADDGTRNDAGPAVFQDDTTNEDINCAHVRSSAVPVYPGSTDRCHVRGRRTKSWRIEEGKVELGAEAQDRQPLFDSHLCQNCMAATVRGLRHHTETEYYAVDSDDNGLAILRSLESAALKRSMVSNVQSDREELGDAYVSAISKIIDT